jgi:hypothetical protein
MIKLPRLKSPQYTTAGKLALDLVGCRFSKYRPAFVVDRSNEETASWMKKQHLEKRIRWSLAPRTSWPMQMSGLVLPRKREDFQAGAENLGGE